MGIKVLDLDERTVIGLKRAIYRDSFWVVAFLAGTLYILYIQRTGQRLTSEVKDTVEEYLSTTSSFWLLLEVATMFTNSKRRAVHDYLAHSVVVRIDK